MDKIQVLMYKVCGPYVLFFLKKHTLAQLVVKEKKPKRHVLWCNWIICLDYEVDGS